MKKTRETVKEISRMLQEVTSLDDPLVKRSLEDDRKAVQQLVKGWIRNYERNKQLEMQFNRMSSFEREARKNGHILIAGIDEAGRGPIAGPVVAAAVILKEDFFLLGLTDSKQLTKTKRDLYFETIVEEALAFSVGIVKEKEIDEINIYQAAKKAMIQAVQGLSETPDMLLIDAMELSINIKEQSLIKGDSRSISIAAGSVIAKVTRDRLMEEIAREFPMYGFEKHMGYGTKEHIEAIKKYGITPYHRKSFSPVKEHLLMEDGE
ncbi:ribonuclease HII [Metabacillus sp. RGM 3146]|uniref:ribonuclease HII n=1 Tax=Metabacillus sp. RGM 3146 TaxID=3401092 RepID=UPI003B9ACD87